MAYKGGKILPNKRMMAKKNEEKTFHRITNEDIYQELETIKKDLEDIKSQLKLVKWIASSALTISVALVSSMIYNNLILR